MNQSTDPDFRLVACDRDGHPLQPFARLPDEIAAACAMTADHHRQVGYAPPWVGYIAVVGEAAIGGGAFVAPPREGRVEIAYFTIEALRGRGYATRTARALVAIAKAADPTLEVFAKTEPRENASTAILARLGFVHVGVTTDHEIGEAWEWVLR